MCETVSTAWWSLWVSPGLPSKYRHSRITRMLHIIGQHGKLTHLTGRTGGKPVPAVITSPASRSDHRLIGCLWSESTSCRQGHTGAIRNAQRFLSLTKQNVILSTWIRHQRHRRSIRRRRIVGLILNPTDTRQSYHTETIYALLGFEAREACCLSAGPCLERHPHRLPFTPGIEVGTEDFIKVDERLLQRIGRNLAQPSTLPSPTRSFYTLPQLLS